MKILVQEVTEHTVADVVSIPSVIKGGTTKYREIAGERRQAVEVVVQVLNPLDDIDTWREQVGHEITVIPWEKELPPLGPGDRYFLAPDSPSQIRLECIDCPAPGSLGKWDIDQHGATALPKMLAVIATHETQAHG